MLSKSKPKPSAPRLEDMVWIYGEEQGIDVIFLVGRDETWRLPAHKGILQNATPVFQAMFSEHFVPHHLSEHDPHTIIIPDLDGRAFDNLLRHLYNEPVTFKAVETALTTLFAAHKYQSAGLVQLCVHYLNQNVNVSNVLQILSNVPLLCGNIQNLENRSRERQMMQGLSSKLNQDTVINKRGSKNLQQAVPISQTPTDAEDLDSIETQCYCLLQNCLQFVDQKAPAILQSDEMEDLDLDTIRLILQRDTLDISDENLVFTAILKWADKECKRQQLQLTPKCKRRVLGESLFLPRYFTMTLKSFESDSGPAKSGIFYPDEIACLTSVLKLLDKEMHNQTQQSAINPTFGLTPKSPSFEIPASIIPYFKTWGRPRYLLLPMGESSPAKKAKKTKGLNFAERWKNRRFCCRNRRNQRSHSNNSSQLSSPANSNPSSPIRSPHTRGARSHPNNWNTAVERIVIFFAWLID